MKKITLVGRENEIARLNDALISKESELISVVGRRRVGKTFLIETVFAKKIDFAMTGLQNANKQEQLENFVVALNMFAKMPLLVARPKSWLEAFRLLILFLEGKGQNRKRIVFFDELPWLASHRSGFLSAFGFFWNSWAAKNNVVVVICGSAASWMIEKVIRNKGGLYNRITKRLKLQPFTLNETEQFLRKRNIKLDHYQLVELYMLIGGIPHYLKEIKRGESIAQNIDRICFNSSNGMLYDEFAQLYPALFDRSENHIAIIRALAARNSGLSRKEIIKLSGIPNGGGLSKTLDELKHSDFISEYVPFGKKKRETLYRLTDEYSLFYLKFIEPLKKEGKGVWESYRKTATYKTWSGYAFESVCLKHINQIKKALGIAGIFSSHASFYTKGKDGMDGCQIDLVIDRDDRSVNVCEIKFSNTEFVVTKAYAADLRRKLALFKHYTKTKKQLFLTFISTFGLLPNEHGAGVVDREIKLDSLFD